jgi:hypothetical protein
MLRPTLRTIVLSAIALAIGWVLLVAGTKLDEMIVGAGVVLLTTLLLIHICRRQPLFIAFRARDLLQAWRIPGYIVKGCAQITWVLLKDLAGHRAGSFYRTAGFRTSARDPEAIARTVLATLYSSGTPNFIVIGVDPARSLILFHQIARTPVMPMTKALGAQEGLAP